MQVLRNPKQIQQFLKSLKPKGKTIGFVPTMGYLHEGHLSLVRLSNRQNDVTVVSIFVNPLQFGPKEDLKKYPRDLKHDLALLKKENVDLVFIPDNSSVYPDHFQTTVKVSSLSEGLCGASRPTHFAGVTTVVAKLLNMVSPDALYLGQKDYQQFKVIEKMVSDLNMPVRVVMAPIVREKDGLAISSRNVHLGLLERKQAVVLHQALLKVQREIRQGQKNTAILKKSLKNWISRAPLGRVDYAEIVDVATLKPVVKLRHGQKLLAAVAANFGQTRLIDNLLIKV